MRITLTSKQLVLNSIDNENHKKEIFLLFLYQKLVLINYGSSKNVYGLIAAATKWYLGGT